MGLWAGLRRAAWSILLWSAVMGAMPAAALPPGYPMRVNDPPKPALYTLASVGRDDGYAGHESHVGEIDGLNLRLKRFAGRGRQIFRDARDRHQRVPVTGRQPGAPAAPCRSLHLFCLAADIKVAGVSRPALVTYVRSLQGIGGIGIYCGNAIVHVDLGPRRTWSYPCRRKAKHK